MIKVVCCGLGPIGIETAKLILKNKNLKIIQAFEIDKNKIGKRLEEVLQIKEKTGVIVEDAKDKVKKADVAIHTVGSHVKDVYPHLAKLIKAGLNIVSSCEELLYPQLKNPELARKIGALAKEYNVAVLGTGVNPGFVMDRLVMTFSGVCSEIDSIYVERVVDASKRRGPLQKKVGAGLSVEKFESLKTDGKIGHVGLAESLAITASALGWKPDKITETLKPIISDKRIKTDFVSIEKGQVLGINQKAIGIKQGRPAITLVLRMYVGAENPFDEIIISGKPNIHMMIENGIHGDVATISSLVNYIPIVVSAESGLKTIKDLPAPVLY